MIDWDKFNLYMQSYGKEVILEVIDIFINEFPQNISDLKKNVEEMDFPQLDIHAHTLKSNCAIFGATEAAKLALKLELMGKKKVDEDMIGVLAQLVPAGEELIKELEQYKKSCSS